MSLVLFFSHLEFRILPSFEFLSLPLIRGHAYCPPLSFEARELDLTSANQWDMLEHDVRAYNGDGAKMADYHYETVTD